KAGWLAGGGWCSPVGQFLKCLAADNISGKVGHLEPGRTPGPGSSATAAKPQERKPKVPKPKAEACQIRPTCLPLPPSRSGSLLPPVAFFLFHSVPRPFSYTSFPVPRAPLTPPPIQSSPSIPTQPPPTPPPLPHRKAAWPRA
uniref:Uncharacterized protein n=1 Tax=Aegilops tauschii subsp. strangulata TaxID=200361 RepID=A0A453NFE0_AEGTS